MEKRGGKKGLGSTSSVRRKGDGRGNQVLRPVCEGRGERKRGREEEEPGAKLSVCQGTGTVCKLLQKLQMCPCPLCLTHSRDEGARGPNEVTQSLDWDLMRHGVCQPRHPLLRQGPKVRQGVGVCPWVKTHGVGIG